MKKEMKKKQKLKYETEISIFIRYAFILLSVYFFLSEIFLNVLMTSFSYISYFFLKLITTPTISENIISLPGNVMFLVVKECIAPNAYMLITLVFFSLPIELKTLFKIWLKSVLWFSFFNLIRILLLMFIHVELGTVWFDKVHLIFYEGLSGVVTALIIIYYLRREKIKGIFPIYSDVKYLVQTLNRKKIKK